MTRDDVIDMAAKAGMTSLSVIDVGYLMDFAAIVAAASASVEREACAGECDEWIKNGSALAEDIATAVRARGNT